MADLLKNDHSHFVENERGRICRLMRRIPTQSIQVGNLIVRICHKYHVGRQLGLLFEELLRMLIEISGRSRVDQEHSRVLRLEVRGMVCEIMNLLDAVRTLIARKTSQYHQNEIMSFLFG